jgi:ParB family chromosome partitioning protein
MATTYDPTTADPGQIEKIPAGSVVIDPNVRTAVRLDKSFVSSIRVLGFQQHPVGYRDGDQVHITVGQRRISAALEIGWPVIPIVIKPRRDAESDRNEELRLLEQIAENEQRLALTPAEIAGGYKQLSLLGVTDEQIGRKTNTGKAAVKTALTVADSHAALAAAGTHQITLDQAAVIADFDGDDQAVTELNETAAANPEQLQHVAEKIRGRRLDDAAIAELRTKIENSGAEYVESFRDVGAEQIGQLWRTDDEAKTRLTLPAVKLTGYTGLVACVYRNSWNTRTGKHRGYEILWGIKDHKTQGLTTYGERAPLTDTEKEARRQKRIDKAEMIAATEVRRRWIRDELLNPARKNLPDDAIVWIAHELWKLPGTLRPSYGDSDSMALTELLDHAAGDTTVEHDPITGAYVSGTTRSVMLALRTGSNPTRIALAMAIARTEDVVGNPKGDSFGQDARAAIYLRQLAEWGYVLSPVENRAIALADALIASKKAIA